MNYNITNRNMIDSNTAYHEDTSSDEIDDLDARIARYANLKGKPIGDFTDDSGSGSDSDEDSKEEDQNEDESESSNESEEEEEEEIESQTESFNVSVRVRPLFSKEKMLKYKSIISVKNDKYVVLKNPEVSNKNDYLSMKRDRQKRFQFDNVFDSKIPTEAVYKKTVRRLIKSILEGYNGTVFAYGATGSGKTYTMLGSDNEPGVMIHTLRDLFKLKEKQSDKYTFRIVISFLEIYNENIADLLVKKIGKKGKRKYLDLRETPQKGVIIAGITFKPADNVSEVMRLLNMGNKRRTTESTAANAVSSRSHAVLQIYVERKSKDLLNDRDIRCGKLNLIDLAGSEKGSVVKSGNRSGMREGANINKSLLALSKCINSLVDKKKFIPYRDSKLTRLLQDALGGNCKTVMICNISPSSNTWDDTHNTLKYADRAKNIRIKKAEINKMKNDNKNDLNEVINHLKVEVNNLRLNLLKTQKEKKVLKRKSKLIIKESQLQQQQQQQQQHANKSSLGLLSEKDLQLLTMARDKLKNKMINLDNLHLKLNNLNDEQTHLLSQELAMKQMLAYNHGNNYELQEKYNSIMNKISNIKLQKLEIEQEIEFIVNNTNSAVNTLVKQHSDSKHLHSMIEKENELFLAQVNKKTTDLNMSFIQNKYQNQETQIKKITEENQKKHDILVQQNEEFERIRSQLKELKQSQIETQQHEQNELQKQLTFFKQKYQEEAKENELKLQAELDQLKQLKEEQMALIEENNKPKRKANIKPADLPYTRWDKSDVYYWLCDELCIDESFAMLVYQEGFDGDGIGGIKEDDLKEIGITAMGVRKKIVKNIDLLQQKLNQANMSTSTLATSVAWNSMYKGLGGDALGHNNNLSLTDSVFSDMTSVSQVDAKRQMRLMQEQLRVDPHKSDNPQFMMQMLHLFASSQQLLVPQGAAAPRVSNVPQALPEEEEIIHMDLDHGNNVMLQEAHRMDEIEEKSASPLMSTIGDDMCGEMQIDEEIDINEEYIEDDMEDEDDVQILKEKQYEAKQAVNKLVHKIRESLTNIAVDNILPAQNGTNGIQLTPGYHDDEYDIKFGNDNDEDSDEDKPFDYDESWMYDKKINSFNIILLSPYKSLRKSFLKFCFEPDIIANRKRTLSYKRYEKRMQCGTGNNNTFIFRILECYESNYIPDLFDNQLVECIFMIFPMDIYAQNISNKEMEFMQDLDTWLASSGHWDFFWNKTVSLLDRSLSFKKTEFNSLSDYFEKNHFRQKLLNDLLGKFNVPNISSDSKPKWINIDTNPKSKLKIKDRSQNGKKYKFRWPNIPNKSSGDGGEDWRLPLTLKVFDDLSEPNTSYFLTSALLSPQKNLIAPTFEATAQSAYKHGPFAAVNMNENDEEEMAKKAKKEKKKKKKEKKRRDREKEKEEKSELLSDSPQSIAQSVELTQTKTESVADNAAILDDNDAIPSAPTFDDNEAAPAEAPVFDEVIPMEANEAAMHMEENEKEMQQQLMQEAFVKFQQKKQEQQQPPPPPGLPPPVQEYEEAAVVPLFEIEEDIDAGSGYGISAPPDQRNGNIAFIVGMDMDDDDDGDGGGDVTPPVDDYFAISPSPFPDVYGDGMGAQHGNSKPIINKLFVAGNKDLGRRQSKAFHGYQPSWANSKTNKLQNTWSYYQTNNVYDTSYNNMNNNRRYSIGADSDDDELDDRLDFTKTKSSEQKTEKTFSRRYVSANRNQSIMRYQDILDQSTKAVDDINEDFNPAIFDVDEDTVIQRSASKYNKKYNYNANNNHNEIQQRKSSYNSNYNNYSSPVEKADSISSTHYSGQRGFGAKPTNKNRKKGNMLKRISAWMK